MARGDENIMYHNVSPKKVSSILNLFVLVAFHVVICLVHVFIFSMKPVYVINNVESTCCALQSNERLIFLCLSVLSFVMMQTPYKHWITKYRAMHNFIKKKLHKITAEHCKKTTLFFSILFIHFSTNNTIFKNRKPCPCMLEFFLNTGVFKW